MRPEDVLTGRIIGAAIEVHRTLGGPGLSECVYEEALAWELDQQGMHVQRQVEVPIVYKGRRLSSPLRMDILVNGQIVEEIKLPA